MNRHSIQRVFHTLTVLCAGVLFYVAAGRGQTAVSAVGGGQAAAGSGGTLAVNATRVETEVVVISASAAVPDQIKRKAGKFFLVLKSKTGTAPASLTFDSPTFTAAQTASLIQGVNLALFQRLKHTATLLDLPPGELHLKSATGKVFLKIIIQ